jgi:hypothetical protein
MSLRGLVPDPPGNGDQSGRYLHSQGMPTAGPTRKRHGVSLSRRGRLSLSRVPHVCPPVQPRRACCCNLYVNHAMLAPDQIDAMPSQREAQLDDDADYQTAYQSARTVAVNGGRA